MLAGAVLLERLERVLAALAHALEILLDVHDRELGGVPAIARVLDLALEAVDAARHRSEVGGERRAERLERRQLALEPADLARARERARRRAQPARQRAASVEHLARARDEERRRARGAESLDRKRQVVDQVDVAKQTRDQRGARRLGRHEVGERPPHRDEPRARALGPSAKRKHGRAPDALFAQVAQQLERRVRALDQQSVQTIGEHGLDRGLEPVGRANRGREQPAHPTALAFGQPLEQPRGSLDLALLDRADAFELGARVLQSLARALELLDELAQTLALALVAAQLLGELAAELVLLGQAQPQPTLEPELAAAQALDRDRGLLETFLGLARTRSSSSSRRSSSRSACACTDASSPESSTRRACSASRRPCALASRSACSRSSRSRRASSCSSAARRASISARRARAS